MGKYEYIKFEEGRIAIITFNRPKVLNAMHSPMIREMIDAVAKVRDNEEMRILVFRGAGKAFSAGADISELEGTTPMELRNINWGWVKLYGELEYLRKPVIAAVHGYAAGGGTELSLSCDMVIAADDAKFGLAEINVGIFPGSGAAIRVTRWVGKAKAMELLMTGEFIDAQEAWRIGLINKVVPRDKLMDAIMELAEKLASKAPLALGAVKAVVNIGGEMDRDKGIYYAVQENALLFSTEDQKEGMQAFLEKRKPVFKGR